MVKSQIDNLYSPIRLTPRQRELLEAAHVRGRVAVSLRDRTRRRAALRLKGLGLFEWSTYFHAWMLTEAGRENVQTSNPGAPGPKIQIREAAYSDYCRDN